MSLGERLLKYAETVITLSKALEETREYIRDIRGGVSDNRERIIRLEEKYEQLREFNRIREIPAPAHLEPILRPYQVHGFHWLNYLQEVNWGGILADDMGLGKTVQALSFLQHFRDTNGRLSALVVCPTTLMFNWENEIKKFTPSLTYHIHHGGDRTRNKQALSEFNVIITTYGTLRSDIKLLLARFSQGHLV